MKNYDLTLDPELSPTIGLLFAMVNYNFSRLKRHLDGLSQDEIDYKGPLNDMNSIAQLIRHLTVVDLHWIYRLQSMELPQEWNVKYGPIYDSEGKLPMILSIPLEILFTQYEEVQIMLREVCLQKTDEELEQSVPFENGHSSTIRWGLWHIADHSRHHFSNMIYLKKLQRNSPRQ